MGMKARRKNQNVGSSNMMIIPAGLEIGESSSIAANRLVLADVRGIIPENDLLEFLETKIEPEFWKWYQKKKKEIEERVNEKNKGGKKNEEIG